MITNKAKRIQAFKKLQHIAMNSPVQLCHTREGGIHSPLFWGHSFLGRKFKTEQDRQWALDEILDLLFYADYPNSVGQVQKEKELARLVLDAGANPNRYACYEGRNLFESFIASKKIYIALEIAKTNGFAEKGRLKDVFDDLENGLNFYLRHKRSYPGNTQEESDMNAQRCSDRKELVSVLFQKGIYPRDAKVFEKLMPIVLEKDPEFLKKQQMVSKVKCAKTPLQIYNALMGKRKEKN